MSRHRQRPLYIAAGVIVVVWILAWTAFTLFRNSKMTAERVKQYQESIDLRRLSAADRMKALRALVDKLNALSPEERRQWHLDTNWFARLSEEEKAWFLDAVLPGEFKQALATFEQWPKERQQEEIDKALKELRTHNVNVSKAGPSGAPILTPELDNKVRTQGLNALYSQGSAQTKAQLAPLLIELQKQMENGQFKLH